MIDKDETIPNELIEAWRVGQSRTMAPRQPVTVENAPRAVAIMSIPRLGWSDNFGCVHDVFMPLGIPIIRHSGVFWGQGLTRLMQGCMNGGVEFIVTLDYDSIFTRQHVARLFQLMAENPELDCVVPVQMKRENNTSMFTIRGEDGQFLTSVKAEAFMRPLTKIATGHFGLTVIRTESLRRLSTPWLKSIPDLNGEWEAGHIDEDIYFWLNAESSGWNVALANEVRIGHLQRVVTWPRWDFTPQFQYLSQWNENGQPEVERMREAVEV